MKRIVILTQFFPPEIGAPQTRLSELALGLKKRGWELEVITAMPNYPHGQVFKEYKGRFSCRETYKGIPVQRYWLYASNAPRNLPRVLSMLSFTLSSLQAMPQIRRFRPHYILVESPPLALGLSAWLLSKYGKSRLILNVSDLWPLSALALGAIRKGWAYSRLEKLESFLYTRAFACSGQSAEIVEHLNARGSRRTHLFRNSVDIGRFEAIHLNKPKAPGTLKLVYTGLLGVAQGILKICSNVNFKALSVELHIYGAGSEQQALQNFLAENLEHGIKYHGPVQASEIPAILQQYDAAFVTLKAAIPGAVPSKIYEAMAAGLPIVFSGNGEAARIIKEHRLGWVSDAGDIQQLITNISLFHQNAEMRSEYSINCLAVAKNRFNRALQIDALHAFLLENIGE